jgi:RNA polymerase sigma-70 factor (ECF subfamily)
VEQATGNTGMQAALADEPARESDEEALWQQEYELRLFRWAAERVRSHFEESSWQAFWRTAVEGQSARQVASELEMTIGALYTAKSRVLERIKREIQQLHGEERSPIETCDERGNIVS